VIEVCDASPVKFRAADRMLHLSQNALKISHFVAARVRHIGQKSQKGTFYFSE
jgi:hypothetical protein